MGHVGDPTHVLGDVFADSTVAARRRSNEDAVHVFDRECQSVDLRLDHENHVVGGGLQGLRGALAPGAQLGYVKDVVEAQHRLGVGHRREERRRRRADFVRDGVLDVHFGMFSLEGA